MLPFSIWREAFINDADLDVARASYEQLSPAPYQQITEPLDLRKFYTLDTPRSYLNGTEDIAIPGCPAASGCSGWSKCRAATRLSSQIQTAWPTRLLKLDATEGTSVGPHGHAGADPRHEFCE